MQNGNPHLSAYIGVLLKLLSASKVYIDSQFTNKYGKNNTCHHYIFFSNFLIAIRNEESNYRSVKATKKIMFRVFASIVVTRPLQSRSQAVII